MDRFFCKKVLFPIFVVSLFSQAAFAKNPIVENQWLVGVGGGVANQSLSKSTTRVPNGTAVPAPYNTDIFSINTSDPVGVLSLFGGYQWNRGTTNLPYYSLMLRYEHQFDANVNGKVQQYAAPELTNYSYSMDLRTAILAVTGKLGLTQYKSLIPFLSAGLGVAFNKLNNYTEFTTSPGPSRVSPNYGSHSNTNFAFTVGAGVDFVCNDKTWITLAYEYWDLGKINSSSGAGSWSSTSLNFGTLKSNALSVTGTYFVT